MSQQTERHQITKMRVVYRMPGMDGVTIRRDVEYRATDAGALTMDIYYPPAYEAGARTAAVVFVLGYSDVGFQRMLGCKQKEMESYISWAQLAAASGLVAITYETTDPATDVHALMDYLRKNDAELGIDANCIGVWACSGNGPNALSVLMQGAESGVKCAVLCYTITLDLDGATDVAEAARQWGFANPCAGKSVADLPQEIPLFVVRAGRDQTPRLNETIDRFIAAALRCNLAIRIENHRLAPHSFDVMDDSETTREIIREVLAFMRFHLSGANAEPGRPTA
ncbi:MAG TPA: alpha/beta hydrolase [Blastocatellia bacterium]|nr:alpha/beta hydrolase [Blastocatellia bacterium]